MQGAFFSVEGCQFFANTWVPNHDGIALDGVRVKGVQWLAQFVQDVIGGIHNVVLGVHADSPQPLLDCIWRRPDTNAFDQKAQVPGATIARFNGQVDGSFGRREWRRCRRIDGGNGLLNPSRSH